jgi:hypothetical protein
MTNTTTTALFLVFTTMVTCDSLIFKASAANVTITSQATNYYCIEII